jgi:hypothetical protein
MRKSLCGMFAALALAVPALGRAQTQLPVATYITDEQVKSVNALPGTDRQIVSVDIGKLNLAVGVIHRGPTGGAAAAAAGGAGARAGGAGAAAGGGGAAAGGAAAGRAGGAPAAGAAAPAAGAAAAAAAATQSCGREAGAGPSSGVSGIAHDHQTETYIIISGSGTLVTGGFVINGRQSAPNSAVTTTLNGPSCSGMIGGSDVVRRVVKTGDIIIIPATVPHGWTDIADHVDYLSVRPDPDRVLPSDYVHPSLR